MDQTLKQILNELVACSRELELLRLRVTELELLHFGASPIPPITATTPPVSAVEPEAQQLTNGAVRTAQEVPDGAAVVDH